MHRPRKFNDGSPIWVDGEGTRVQSIMISPPGAAAVEGWVQRFTVYDVCNQQDTRIIQCVGF
jgi:hypothetical protein